MDLSHLALAFGGSLTAGLRLYLTTLSLGLMHRFEVLTLPENLQVLANPWVLGASAALLAVEFFADKIPLIDNAWDTVHAFLRVPAGAVLAASFVGDVNQPLVWVAALAGGFVSFTAHGAKASTRLAVNSSPEPFSNWFLSLAEDGISLLLLYLISSHPLLALILATTLFLFFLGVLVLLYKFVKALFRPGKAVGPQPTG